MWLPSRKQRSRRIVETQIQQQELDVWKRLANDAYIREPNYGVAAAMVLGLHYAATIDEFKTIAFAGLKSRLLERPPNDG